MAKSRSLGFLLTLLLSLGVVACSTAAPATPAGGAASSSAAAAQGVENKVITVGLSTVLSGPSAVISQVSEGAKTYLDTVNRNRGVNGYTFKIVERDNANQAAQGVSITQQLLNEDKAFALLVFGTPVVQAIAPMATSLKAPMVAYADSDLVRKLPNVFGINNRYSLLPLFQAQYLIKNLGIKELAYVYPDNASGRPGLETLPPFVSANGAKLNITVGFPLDAADWAPYAQKVKDSGAQGVVFYDVTLPQMQKAADAIGYHPTWVGNFGNLQPSYLKLAGPLAEGTYITGVAEPVDAPTPEVQKFTAEMKTVGKESIIGLLSGQGWTMGAVIEEGVRRATANGATLTWDAYIDALNKINNQQLGVYPSITYTPEDHTGATQSAMYQVQNGKFVQALPMIDIPQPGVS